MISSAITVPVSLGDRSYDIYVGRNILQDSATLLARLGARQIALVTDKNIYQIHGQNVVQSLMKAGMTVAEPIVVTPGESSKSYQALARTCDDILATRVERGDLVVALGGGVVGDLAGFAAAIVRRGMRFVQIPTSFLAQVDSSVGGKTGINSPHGKNLVGAFHQPSLVIADTALLDTLPLREMRAGYAEAVKYGLINDETFFSWCEQNWKDVFLGGAARDHAIAHSCRSKAAIVARDEREDGDRALLNLGHTFGHALERIVNYDNARLVHGEAVAIGIAQAFRFSTRLGLCSEQDAIRVEKHFQDVGLPTRLRDVPGGCGTVEVILDAMAQDKKVKSGELTFILAHGIGRSFIAPKIAQSDVLAFLNDDWNR